MRLIYTVILYLLLPFVLLRLLVRSLRAPSLRSRWQERLGYLPALESNLPWLWIHAVSVGEVRAARPLVDNIRGDMPGCPILITTMTLTGAATVRQLFGQSVAHRYVPYDLPGAVKRFLANVKPRCLIVMETELWPNLFHYCRLSGIPVFVANGRMSPQSARRYRLLPGLTRDTLQNISRICAQSRADADQFLMLGAGHVSVTGSMKYDVALPGDFEERLAGFQRNWSVPGPVWIAASTHAGEERIVLQAHTRVLEQFTDSLLILAPRHPDRFAEVTALCERSGFNTQCRSTQGCPTASARVFVLDTLGELPWFYAMAQAAFVGGSLVPAGGHNMLEPAALGIPVLTGPHLQNFQEIGRHLLEAGAARVVSNGAELSSAVINLFSDDKLRHDTGRRGRDVVECNRGGVARCMKIMHPYLAQGGTISKNVF